VSRRARAEEDVRQERWLVSYADLMTLLFAVFVVLFASSYRDKKAIQRVSSAVKNGFQELGSFSIGDDEPVLSPSGMSGSGKERSGAENRDVALRPMHSNGSIDANDLRTKLNESLGKEIARQEVVMRVTPEGFVISLRELGFFDSGEARLLPGAADKIRRIATVLMQYGLDMRVEGHSDDVPIHNAAFASNWDLSTARAMAVAMMLLNDSGFDPKRLSIAGYAQYHPTASNDTPEGRRANRRVDIVIVSVSQAEAVKALRSKIDAVTSVR
jgi:chemotaxis protein MotB